MINEKIELLDHGYIRLVEHMGSDKATVNSARVSYQGKGKSSDEKLIKYLMINKHSTPFESSVVKFEIMAPIFVIRQWQRHRTQSFSELSARYRELPNTYYIPAPHRMNKQSENNKQMSSDNTVEDPREVYQLIKASCENSYRTYQNLLRSGLSRELARSVLPVSFYSHMESTANLHNWLGFIRLRNHDHAQHEIRVYAQAIQKVLTRLYPLTMKAFMATT